MIVAYELNRMRLTSFIEWTAWLTCSDTVVVVLRYMRFFEWQDVESVIFQVSLVLKEL